MRLRGKGKRRGAAAAELAILMPVFGFLIGVVADYSRIFYTLATLTDVARAGAVYYSSNATTATTSSTQAVAKADATNLTNAPTITVVTANDASGNAYVKVTATYSFSTLFPHPTIPSPVTLTRKVIMMVNP